MFAVIVNVITVIVGSTVGLLCKKGIPKRLSDAVMLGIGLCTLYIGISGTLKGENTIVLILSMVLGAIIGTALDIDEYGALRVHFPDTGTETVNSGEVSVRGMYGYL